MFQILNGFGELIINCLNVFPEKRDNYLLNKDQCKKNLGFAINKLTEKLRDRNKIAGFLQQAIFNGNEVDYLTIKDENNKYHVFSKIDVINILKNNFTVSNSIARTKLQYDDQKTLFKYKNINYGEIEVRNDSNVHYREIKFHLNGKKITNLLKEKLEKPKIIIKNDFQIFIYFSAIKKFKI